MLPTKVFLDACTLCQLNCRSCWMRMYDNFSFGYGYLKFENFVRFNNLNPYIKEIELSNSGEIFLNPELDKIIKYGFDNGIKLTANTGVNFNNVSPKILEYLVKYSFESFVISIDGWDQESYSWYRRGGNFDAVINNIRLLNGLKEKYNSRFPKIAWKYIVFPGNDNLAGLEIAKKMAASLDMTFLLSKDYWGYEPRNIKSDDPDNSIFDGFVAPCSQLWFTPRINYDGRFFGCCENTDNIYDPISLFDVPLANYLENEFIKDTKLLLMGKQPHYSINPKCVTCRYYKNMKQQNCFISEKELESGIRLVGA